MPAKDFYNDVMRNSLMRDGWTIAYAPFRLPVGSLASFFEQRKG
ncbi:hypothetical protein D0962_30535 [Leptolyngbyaceae cyanobacterium CCMR0082]|uniref:Uncharacterized protein n=2 Tax=Adonisia turfae TaxID=2950184 RepID=A0A6M0SEZ2_9CYAN|nr:hypothetical protein [Adonisia turfae CCMR0081]NEZ67039.1 hypothetical protein [Adonisia turfae CCMR0082]